MHEKFSDLFLDGCLTFSLATCSCFQIDISGIFCTVMCCHLLSYVDKIWHLCFVCLYVLPLATVEDRIYAGCCRPVLYLVPYTWCFLLGTCYMVFYTLYLVLVTCYSAFGDRICAGCCRPVQFYQTPAGPLCTPVSLQYTNVVVHCVNTNCTRSSCCLVQTVKHATKYFRRVQLLLQQCAAPCWV